MIRGNVKMSILNKYNRKPVFKYDNEKERNYTSLIELANEYGLKPVYEIHAFFINTKSKFGNAPIIVIENHFVNAPHHLLETVQNMIADEEIIQLVNDRKLGFKIYDYNGKNGHGYSVEWVEKKVDNDVSEPLDISDDDLPF